MKENVQKSYSLSIYLSLSPADTYYLSLPVSYSLFAIDSLLPSSFPQSQIPQSLSSLIKPLEPLQQGGSIFEIPPYLLSLGFSQSYLSLSLGSSFFPHRCQRQNPINSLKHYSINSANQNIHPFTTQKLPSSPSPQLILSQPKTTIFSITIA